MFPCDQRLHAVDHNGAKVDFRLVMQHELLDVHRGPQFLHPPQPMGWIRGIRALAEQVPVAAGLRSAQRNIGFAQQRRQIRTALRRKRDLDAHRAFGTHQQGRPALPRTKIAKASRVAVARQRTKEGR